MEEHVALDSKKQKKFVKSLKGIKKLMKETGALPETPQKEKKPVEGGKIKKKRLPRRGLVYLSHIPHGFYEHQMTEYFKQFGMVTNVRVIRSKRTGRSKGHAFVEFKNISVAEVVAETMNNYLMGKRLIKAVYIPPKDQRVHAKRKPWNPQNNPGRTTKLNMKKAYNAKKSENEDMKIARKLFSNLTNTKNKLKELGIDYDFFTPVDMPEGLLDQNAVKKEENKDEKDIDEKPNKKKENRKDTKDEATYEKTNNIANPKQEKATKKDKKQKKLNKDVESNEKITAVANKNNKQSNGTAKTKDSAKNKKNKKENIETVFESNKKQKLQEAGVKPLEDYISIADEGDDDSDSSYHFDSDEYDNELNEDSDVSDDDDDEDSNEDEENEVDDKNQDFESVDDSDREEMPVQTNNRKTKRAVLPSAASKPKVKHVPFMELMKRKLTEKVSTPSKKPKFEKKHIKKLPSKQLKKKK